MGIFTEMTALEKRMLEIKKFADETIDKMVAMEMTYDDFDYFRSTLNSEISTRPIGKR